MVNQSWKNIASYALIGIVTLELLASVFHFQKNLKTIVVQAESSSTPMYFSGIVNPKNTYPIICPTQGTVISVKKQYGEWVKKDIPLFTISSPQLEENLQSSFESYIRAKADVGKQAFQSNGSKELFRLGLISKITYLDSVGQLQSAELSLYLGEQKLRRLLNLVGKRLLQFQNFTLADLEKVHNLLRSSLKEFTINSPAEGVLLFPTKSLAGGGSSSENETAKIQEGSIVKDGQILAIIGDLSGLLFEIIIDETNFHNIKMGQSGIITGSAFPDIQLKGIINSINRQANSSSSDTTPMYSAQVIVPHLTLKEREAIQIGMSAKITFTKENPPIISIPIADVMEKNGTFFVKRLNKKNNKVEDVPVETGSTTETSVQILKGLSSGDEIVDAD